MALKRSGRSSRYSNKRASRQSTSHWFRNLLLLGFAVGLFMFISYMSYLDFNVRNQFEGKRLAIPARVYANPVELYAGSSLSPEKLEALLNMLHYRNDVTLPAEGTFYKKGSQLVVKTRDFSFWDQHQPSMLIQINFIDSSIDKITNLTTSKDVPLVRMDPLQIGSL